jgi:hypothetical protein
VLARRERDRDVKTNTEIIDSEIPEKSFFSLRELADIGPYSADYWAKRIKAGEVRVVQHTARQQGSRILIPRNEVVRHLSECVR